MFVKPRTRDTENL